MNPKKINIVCFGEVLFDVFPAHTKIGGAPLNVALRLASLGINAGIISRIGNDNLGKELIDFIETNGVSIANIQVDEVLETGQVLVKLDANGSATYTINYPAAWDKIETNSNAETLLKEANALVFGSLVCRDEVSYNALKQLFNYSNYNIFDVNLRAPFYKKELLLDLMQKADFIKFNDDELYEICKMMDSPYNNLEQNMIFILKETKTEQICVTKGNHGAVLYYNNQFYYNSGYKVQVADTVGSGDSFLAGLLSKLLTENNPQNALDFGCALGALVAQNEGANPKITFATIEDFMKI